MSGWLIAPFVFPLLFTRCVARRSLRHANDTEPRLAFLDEIIHRTQEAPSSLYETNRHAGNDTTLRPPNLIGDVEFIKVEGNLGPIATLMEAFDKWGAKLLLVDFFAYACTNCIRTVPHMRDLYFKFHASGLRILAFARPEFEFEGIAENIITWMGRNSIDYPVATDLNGTNWHAWGVTGWPTHFLIHKDEREKYKGKLVLAYTHVGDRNAHLLYNQIIKLLRMDMPAVAPMDETSFVDVEVFFGKAHRYKNIAEGGCNHETRACEIVESTAAVTAELPRPKPGQHTMYGAAWCPFCRKTKILLELANESFTYIDVDQYGGAGAVLKTLVNSKLVPAEHTTIPMVFAEDAKFVGGYTEELKLVSASKPGLINVDEIDSRASASVVEYSKEDGRVTVFLANESLWTLEDEKLIARVAGSVLQLHARLQIPEEVNGFYAYIVCGPPQSGPEAFEPAWLEIGTWETPKRLRVTYPGRHYLGAYKGSEAVDELRASAGLQIYALWLTTELPAKEDVAADAARQQVTERTARLRKEVVKTFLHKYGFKGVNTGKRTFTGKVTYPLHEAAKRNDIEMVKMLVEEGANLEQTNSKQQTPLQRAMLKDVNGSHAEIIDVLRGLSKD